jgi:hypothetical protein
MLVLGIMQPFFYVKHQSIRNLKSRQSQAISTQLDDKNNTRLCNAKFRRSTNRFRPKNDSCH